MTLLVDARLHPTLNPMWWRIPVWALLTAFSVSQAHGTGLRVATGVLMVLSATALQFVTVDNETYARTAVVLTIALGLAAVLTSPTGVAEVLVVVAATRAPLNIRGVALGWFTVVASVAFEMMCATISCGSVYFDGSPMRAYICGANDS